MPHVLLPVKAAPLGAPLVRLSADGALEQPAEHRLDPINELSVEWAVRQLEAGALSGVTAVAIGAAPAQTALRAARSRGCRDLLRIEPDDAADLDVATVAALLAAAARRTRASVVALGSESFDGSSGVVPAAIAAELGWPLVSRARGVTLHDDTLEATRAAGSGSETVLVDLPSVVSLVDGEIAPRNPRLADVIAARKAEIPVVSAAELLEGRDPASWTSALVAVEAVPRRVRDPRIVAGEDGAREILAAVQTVRGGDAR